MLTSWSSDGKTGNPYFIHTFGCLHEHYELIFQKLNFEWIKQIAKNNLPKELEKGTILHFQATEFLWFINENHYIESFSLVLKRTYGLIKYSWEFRKTFNSLVSKGYYLCITIHELDPKLSVSIIEIKEKIEEKNFFFYLKSIFASLQLGYWNLLRGVLLKLILNDFHAIISHSKWICSRLSGLGLNTNLINHHNYMYLLDDKSISYPLELKSSYLSFEKKDKIRFIFIGHLYPYKGVLDLLKCWSNIHDKVDATLLIAGKPEDSEYAVKLKEYEYLESVSFIFDFLSEKEIALHLKNADIGVLPYRTITNSGVMHLMTSFQKPLVVPDHPYFMDDLAPLSNFFYTHQDMYSLELKLLQAANTPISVLQNMGKSNFNKISCNIPANICDDYLKLYGNIVST